MKDIKRYIIVSVLFTMGIILHSQSINIAIDNPYISIDEWTNLTVTLTGEIKKLKYTEPDGISLTSFGQSTSYSFVNGKNSTTQSISFRVKPLREGTIDLPVFYGIDSNGQKITSEKIKLYVEKGNAKLNNELPKGNLEKENVKLYIKLPERDIYIGESVPVEVEAYFLNRSQPKRKRDPYIKNGSFTLELSNNIVRSNPQVIIGDESYHLLVWEGFLTPLKSGNSELELQMESYIAIPDGSSDFFQRYRAEEVMTRSQKENISTQPLPLEGKPKGFSGAIGKLSMNSSINIDKAVVGDPVTLSIDIFGTGNFNRIEMPEISKGKENWKLYPESSQLQGSAFEGVKKFQQILTPLTDDIATLPTFEFSFFNPETKKYVTLNTEEFPISISPGMTAGQSNRSAVETKFTPEIKNLLHRSSKPVKDFIPFTESTFFKMIFLIILLLFTTTVVLYIITFIKQKNTKSESILVRKYRKQINLMEVEKNYRKALLAYKELIVKHESFNKDINPQSITSEDLKHNQMYYNVLKKAEDINYFNSDIDEDEYTKLTENLIKEII